MLEGMLRCMRDEDGVVEKVVWFYIEGGRGVGEGGVHEERVAAFTPFPFFCCRLNSF